MDRRFNGDQEKSATIRYAIERKRNKKATKFDIDSDDDMQNVRLTHGGQDIDDIDEFKHKTNPDDLNDQFEDKFLDDRIVEKLHFGGKKIEDETEEDFFKVKKTKQEVFNEIIAKSKMFKAARAELKDQNMEMTEQVDADFKALMPLLFDDKRREIKQDKGPEQGIQVSLLEVAKRKNDKEIEKKNANRRRDQQLVKKMAPAVESNYNELAIEMRHDNRVRPSQINKTEQEKALDRKAELLELDKDANTTHKRVKFADNLDDDSDEDQYEDDENKDLIDTDKINDDLVDMINGKPYCLTIV